MIINGQEFEFDIADEKDSAAYQKALEEYNAALAELKSADPVETIRKGNEMIRNFFYTATGKDIMAGVTNLRVSMNCYKDFIQAVKEQGESVKNIFDSMAEKSIDTSLTGGKRPDLR